jgi:hypothetical protein
MSLHVRLWIGLSVLMLVSDLVMLIIGLPNVRFGMTGALCALAGGIHMRLDVIERIAKAMTKAQVRAIERQTDALRGRR